jgi:N-formylglutamate deformylase
VKLPLLLSVPHAGLEVPPEAEPYCALSPEEIAADGDEGAADIYDLSPEVDGFVTTQVARAIVDLNRAPDDRRTDGVVKTHTCWMVPVYDRPLPETVVETLIETHYRPYHQRLTTLGESGKFRLAVDCHTMAATGPPVGPDPGKERPWICLGNAGGSCPREWIERLKGCFADLPEGRVAINDPFSGGYITRSHGSEMPWVQLEMSRAPFMSNEEKRTMVLRALESWCEAPGS